MSASTLGPATAVDAAFVDMLCADDALVRAEFDAIIAAEWPAEPPPRSPGGCRGAPVRHGKHVRHLAVRDVSAPAEHRAVEARARQRSPPAGG